MKTVNMENMKITLTEDSRKVITLADMPAVRFVQRAMKDMYDDGKIDLSSEIRSAVGLAAGANGDCFEILRAEAEILKNGRVHNAYGSTDAYGNAVGEDSGNIDIWLTIYAFDSYYGFYEIGAYLSDLWALSSDNRDEIMGYMLINHYRRQ